MSFEHRCDSKDFDKNLPGDIFHEVKKGDKLWSIVEEEYAITDEREIYLKTQEIIKNNNLDNNGTIFPGQILTLHINILDEHLDNTMGRNFLKNNNVLKLLDEARDKNIAKISTDFEIDIFAFKAEVTGELDYGLTQASFSGELNSNAYDIFKNLKNTRGEQIIGTYRNKDWEVKNIILGDNNGKNIYMELDDSYTWDDISEDNLENINNFDELKEVIKILLKKYEQEVKSE